MRCLGPEELGIAQENANGRSQTCARPLAATASPNCSTKTLSREYQAIIAYVVYSQVLKGAEYMDIADQLELHAKQELDHALMISRQIDYLGEMPTVTPKPVKTSKNAKEMLRFDLDNENETIRNYRDRVRQCEALGEFAHGRADPQDPGAGAGSPDRSGDGARHRSARYGQARWVTSVILRCSARSAEPRRNDGPGA